MIGLLKEDLYTTLFKLSEQLGFVIQARWPVMDQTTVNLVVDDLSEFLFITVAPIQRLKDELPQNSALCEDLAPTIDPLTWRKAHGADLPYVVSCLQECCS